MLCASFFPNSLLLADDAVWPDFLGRSSHQAVDASKLPLQWDPTKNVPWKTKLPGKGQSSPVIWGHTVYVTSIEGSMKERCHVTALNLETGEVLWTREFDAAQTIRSNYFQSRSAPTPVATSNGVFAFFETGNLVALSHAGETLWERNLVDEYGPFESTIGLASSPIALDDSVFLLVDHEGPSYLLSLSQKTGEVQWKRDRDSRVSYSSPSVMNFGDRHQLVCSSNGGVQAYEPLTGELVWEYQDVGANSQNTPLAAKPGTFLVGASPGMHSERESVARESNVCISVSEQEGKFVPKIEWKTSGVMSTFASPMHHQGFCYWVSKAGIVHCFDAETGKLQYKERITGESWVTPIGVGDRIYFFGKDGVTTVVKAGIAFEKLAENTLWDLDAVPKATPGNRGGRSGHEHPKEEGDAKGASEGRPVASAGGSDAGSKPEGGERRGGPPRGAQETEEARAQGENKFADPIQYGVAMFDHGFIVRTGEVVYCVRTENK